MQSAIDLGTSNTAFTVVDIEDIHPMLLRVTEDAEIAGVVRTAQNWIGGNDYNPTGAAYVPPPHEYVQHLLEDLCEFVNRVDLDPIVQAGIAHAQFETIHPFADGNGRVGRALIHAVLRRRGEISNYIPPISLILAAEPKSYIAGLAAYRQGEVSVWYTQFASATARGAREAERLAKLIEERQANWLNALGQPRKDAAVRQLVSALPAQPVIDVGVAQKLAGKSHVATSYSTWLTASRGVSGLLTSRRRAHSSRKPLV